MDLKDFTDMGANIGRHVNDAINNMNFDHLEQDIRSEINQAFGGAGKGQQGQSFGGINGKLYRGADEPTHYEYTATKRPPKNRNAGLPVAVGIPITSKPQGKATSVFMMTVGYAMTGIFGIAAIVLGLLSLTVTAIGSVPAGILGAAAGGMVPLLVTGIILAAAGTKRYGRVNRFRQYLIALKGAKFCAIKDLAKSIGRSPGFVCKDLLKMIQKNFFPEGHIDDQKTCFIGTNAMYNQYRQARDSAAQSATAAHQPESETSDPLEQIIAEGEAYIKTIREANDAIYNKEISEKLYRMEDTVKKIFDYVRDNPGQAGQLRRFTSYYMPMTEKLVNAYRELDKQTIQGENITKAKQEIGNTLDTINEAYEKLYDSMYEEVAMDVSSDIAVLKTLFAQEGLAGDDINGGKKS